jgi:cell division protein FtsW (lipid II flippase)
VTRPALAGIVLVVGLLLLADFIVVNEALADVAGLVVTAAVLVAAGAALAAAASLAARRSTDLWRRRGDPVGAALVLVGIGAMLVAGLRPGSTGTDDPAVGWIVAALLVPIAATLFGLLFVSTLTAARRSAASRRPEALAVVAVAALVVALLLPVGGDVGTALASAASWGLTGPIAAALRGLLIGVAVLVAVAAARTLFGIGGDDA